MWHLLDLDRLGISSSRNVEEILEFFNFLGLCQNYTLESIRKIYILERIPTFMVDTFFFSKVAVSIRVLSFARQLYATE